MSDLDGDLSDVSPALLAMTRDPEAWKEARRKALKQCLQRGGTSDSATGHSTGNSFAPAPSSQDAAGNSAFVLASIMSAKRRRQGGEDGTSAGADSNTHHAERYGSDAVAFTAPPQPISAPPPAPFLPPGLREKLARAAAAAAANGGSA